MKKKILFVIDSLHCAGAEKSLVTLLNLLDYDKYEIDLQLFGYGGSFELLLPAEVNLLSPLAYTSFSSLSIREAIKSRKVKMLLCRLNYSFKIRIKNIGNATKARFFWKCVSRVIESNTKTYDVAIAYAQGVPTFYVAEKVQAKNKCAWVNVSYRLDKNEMHFQERFYNQYQTIVAVSESTKEVFQEVYPQFSNKIEVIYDINDPNIINKMAQIGKNYDDEFKGLRLLTIGRLANQKGYDLALDACRYLRDSGLDFRWYVLGIGPLEKEIQEKITEFGLTDNFILLGVTQNPYSYIKNCDIYVQTSRFEGFGIAIAEARILNKPVVTTRFDAVYNQMVDEKNGLVVDMQGKAIAQGILRLVDDKELYTQITNYLQCEKKGNLEELLKLEKLFS